MKPWSWAGGGVSSLAPVAMAYGARVIPSTLPPLPGSEPLLVLYVVAGSKE